MVAALKPTRSRGGCTGSRPFVEVLCCLLLGIGRVVVAAEPPPPTAPAGSLAELPVRGLSAAIAEAGHIEVPAANPRELLSIAATQASRWTEGAYDVWHLTGGVTIRQGQTEAEANEAVVWIEQPPPVLAPAEASTGPPLRTVLVRLAGTVSVQTFNPEKTAGPETATIRDDRWAGRFWIIRDPQLTFDSIVPASGRPAVYEAPVDPRAAPADGVLLVSASQTETGEEIVAKGRELSRPSSLSLEQLLLPLPSRWWPAGGFGPFPDRACRWQCSGSRVRPVGK